MTPDDAVDRLLETVGQSPAAMARVLRAWVMRDPAFLNQVDHAETLLRLTGRVGVERATAVQRAGLLAEYLGCSELDIRLRMAAVAWRPNIHITDFLGPLVEDGQLKFGDARLSFPDPQAAWVQINEILLDEEYWFECDRPDPLIIDGGVNFGLSLYYFKHRYPKARIVGFEPVPALYELARQNIVQNNWSDIDLHQAALAAETGTATLEWCDRDTMAASLHRRQRPRSDAAESRMLTVATERLSDWLRQPVDFLKLDIEGPEDVVLAEAAEGLDNVRNLFVEYHHGPGFSSGRLGAILSLIESRGFEVKVVQPWGARRGGVRRPITGCGGAFSLEIVGTRRG